MARVWRCILAVVVLICVSLLDSTEAVGGAKSRPRPQRRPKKPKVAPIDAIQSVQSINMMQVRNWRLRYRHSSRCVYDLNDAAFPAVFLVDFKLVQLQNQTGGESRMVYQMWACFISIQC